MSDSPTVVISREGPGTLPITLPEGHVGVVLEIENTYELYPDVVTWVSTVVPAPPSQDGDDDAAVQARSDWGWDNIQPLAGVGHTRGDSWYDVEVLQSTHPDLIPVGMTWNFGY